MWLRIGGKSMHLEAACARREIRDDGNIYLAIPTARLHTKGAFQASMLSVLWSLSSEVHPPTLRYISDAPHALRKALSPPGSNSRGQANEPNQAPIKPGLRPLLM